ncbi:MULTISPECIES: DUF6262 family protein [Streptosporangiaceae]|uniref:DUF6262 family protein n=1 Tax=Streptosporangium vulgare TaxID=46190 RepID=A0ABV5TIT8_9ACTN
MSTPSSRTENANHARQRAIKTMLEQLEATLRQMQRERALITTAAAARRAQVSRSFIYQNPQARQLVAQAAKATSETRADDVARKAEQVEAAWKDRALNAEDGIKAAHAEIVAQRGQIGQLLARLRDYETDLPDDAHGRLLAENTTLKQKVRRLTDETRTLNERLQAARSNARFADRRIAELEAQLLERLDS